MKKEVDLGKRVKDFDAKMRLPYRIKVEYAKLRIKEFIRECDLRELGYYVSVGGLDSITLLCFLRSLHIDCPAVSVSHLEDQSIQKIHKELGVECLKPAVKCVTDDGKVIYWSKQAVLQEFGFPVVSKEIAAKTHCLKHSKSSESGTTRWRTLPQKWQKLLEAPFEVSDRCCYYLKESPLLRFEHENNSAPFLGLMASEGGRRAFYLKTNGCNFFGGRTRSAPLAIFGRQDLLQLALDLHVPVPEVYGKIERKDDGTLYTTKAQRTGCEMCGFGAHLGRPHKFDLLLERNPKAWHYWMYECCTDENGEKFGWARVLDYIGVEYLPDPEQITLF